MLCHRRIGMTAPCPGPLSSAAGTSLSASLVREPIHTVCLRSAGCWLSLIPLGFREGRVPSYVPVLGPVGRPRRGRGAKGASVSVRGWGKTACPLLGWANEPGSPA